MTRPRLGYSNPAHSLSRVVLPHPLGPIMVVNSFLFISRLMSWKAQTSFPLVKKVLDTFSNLITESRLSSTALFLQDESLIARRSFSGVMGSSFILTPVAL